MSAPPAGSLAYWTGERASTMVITGILLPVAGSIGTRGTFGKCPVGYTRCVDCQRSRGRELAERNES